MLEDSNEPAVPFLSKIQAYCNNIAGRDTTMNDLLKVGDRKMKGRETRF